MNKDRKSTIKDVAREAEVSYATVSHVINKTRPVSKATQLKVLKSIKRLNYSINLNARGLRGKSSNLIGAIIPDISNLVMSKLIRSLEKVFYKEGYNIIICDTEGNWEKEKRYINSLKSRSIDCIIIMPSSNHYKHLKTAMMEGIELIVIEREIKNFEVDTIVLNTVEVTKEAINYLIKLGHKRIGFLRRPFELSHSLKRLKGYREALKENDIKFNNDFCPRCNGFGYSGGYFSMSELLHLKVKPTAVAAFNDIAAIGAIKAIKDYGFRVPGDFSVIGFDNISIDEYLDPALSSVTFPTLAIAEAAFSIFIKRLQNKEIQPQKIILNSTLKIRASISGI